MEIFYRKGKLLFCFIIVSALTCFSQKGCCFLRGIRRKTHSLLREVKKLPGGGMLDIIETAIKPSSSKREKTKMKKIINVQNKMIKNQIDIIDTQNNTLSYIEETQDRVAVYCSLTIIGLCTIILLNIMNNILPEEAGVAAGVGGSGW